LLAHFELTRTFWIKGCTSYHLWPNTLPLLVQIQPLCTNCSWFITVSTAAKTAFLIHFQSPAYYRLVMVIWTPTLLWPRMQKKENERHKMFTCDFLKLWNRNIHTCSRKGNLDVQTNGGDINKYRNIRGQAPHGPIWKGIDLQVESMTVIKGRKWKKLPWKSELRLGPMRKGPP
jgi:hypothetical protein